MTPLSSRQRMIAMAAICGFVTVGSLAATFIFELPAAAKHRLAIDNARATILLETQRLQNVQAAAKQLAALHDQQTVLDAQIWKFSNEESFFSLWTDLAHQTGTKIDDPVVADATPGTAPVKRSVDLTVTGPANNVMAALVAIQRLTPLVAMRTVVLAPGTASGQVAATITASTIWN